MRMPSFHWLRRAKGSFNSPFCLDADALICVIRSSKCIEIRSLDYFVVSGFVKVGFSRYICS